MTKHWRIILPGAFLAVSLGLLTMFNASKPRIMVLQSMGSNAPWASEVDAGIRSELLRNRLPVAVEWHYMGDELQQESESVAAASARRAVARFDPDVLIAVDDEANAQIASSFAGLQRPRVVFVSIDEPPARYRYDGQLNVAGIAEILPLAAVREALPEAKDGNPRRISAVGMDSATGRAEMAQVRGGDWGPHRLVAAELVPNFEQLKNFVEARRTDTDILLVLSYAGLVMPTSNAAVTVDTGIAEWIEANAVPLPIGLHVAYVADGGGLGFAPSPRDFGERAMAMAIDWVDPSNGSVPPIMATSEHFDVAIRASKLRARGVTMPSIYIETARLGGRYFP